MDDTLASQPRDDPLEAALSRLQVVLCWGCGGLPWARLQPGQQQRHQVGSLGSWIGLSASGPRYGLDVSRMMPGESPICLSSLIHSEQHWLPNPGWLDASKVELVAEGSSHATPPPPLPSLDQLSDGMADWCGEQLGEPGVLAVPFAWREVPLAQRLMAPWAQRGWRFLALEQLVQRAAGGGRRVITSDGAYLRLHGPVAQLVMPSSIESAGALALASAVLPRILQQAGPTVASYWRELEQQRQEPLVRALLARRILQALRLGAHAISMGGADSPLFFAPAPGAPEALLALHDHRFRVFLPRLPDMNWWERVAEAGFLRSPSGRVLIFGLDWKTVPTIEIEGPNSPWDLPSHLEQMGAQRSTLRAHGLHDHAQDAEPLEAWFPTWTPATAQPAAPSQAPTPETELAPQTTPEPPPPPMEPPPPVEPSPAPIEPPPPPMEPPPPVEAPPAPTEPPPPPMEPPPPFEPPPDAPSSSPAFAAQWEQPRAPSLPPPPSLEPPPAIEPPQADPPAFLEPPAEPRARPLAPPADQPSQAQLSDPRPVLGGLADFEPQQIVVRPTHRADSLRLVVDGQPVPSASLVPTGLGPDGRSWYLIEDCPLRHGALVRVDFEPSWGDS